MKVTSKGQVTIPQEVRNKMGIKPHSEVEFREEKNGHFYLLKVKPRHGKNSRFRDAGDKVKLTMTTDEIMAFTRN